MKLPLLYLIFCALALAQAPTLPVLSLNNGKEYKEARIIAIGTNTVTLVHAGGTTIVPLSEVDLEILARAHLALSEQTEARKKLVAEATSKAEERKAASDAAMKERIDIARAMSAARGNTHQEPEAVVAEKPQPATRPSTAKALPAKAKSSPTQDPSVRIAALKSSFPPKSPGSARLFIPRSGKNAKPYIVSSSVSQLPGGAVYSSTTTRHNAGPGRIDTIQYDAPSDEMWRWYSSTFQTTTVQALPRTLQMVDARLAEDIAKLQHAAGSLSPSTAAQAQHTLHWFDKTFRPYVEKWRAVLN